MVSLIVKMSRIFLKLLQTDSDSVRNSIYEFHDKGYVDVLKDLQCEGFFEIDEIKTSDLLRYDYCHVKRLEYNTISTYIACKIS